MSKKEWCDSLELYALGGLDQDEAARFKLHLDQCTECQAGLAELMPMLELLPMGVEQMEAPQGMKERILSRVLEDKETQEMTTEEPRDSARSQMQEQAQTRAQQRNPPLQRSLWGRAASVVGISAAAAMLAVSVTLWNQKEDLRQELALREAQMEKLQGKLSAYHTPAAAVKMNRMVQLDPAAEGIVASGLATIVIDEKGMHLLVQADKLPELRGSEAYQVWLLKDGEPSNAGTFLTDHGHGALFFTFDPGEYDTVAITHEPDAHGNKPRGKLVLAGAVKG